MTNQKKDMKKTQDNSVLNTKVREMVAQYYKEDPIALHDGNGSKEARDTIMYVLKEGLGQTTRAAREAVSVKSDMTVFQACKRVEKLLKNDSALSAKIEEIKAVILADAMSEAGSPSPASSVDTATEPPTDLKENKRTLLRSVRVVQEAVAEVFLGTALLQSPDPTVDVLLARDIVPFILWSDMCYSAEDITSTLNLGQSDLYTAIGKVSVLGRITGSTVRKKLREVRARYGSK